MKHYYKKKNSAMEYFFYIKKVIVTFFLQFWVYMLQFCVFLAILRIHKLINLEFWDINNIKQKSHNCESFVLQLLY